MNSRGGTAYFRPGGGSFLGGADFFFLVQALSFLGAGLLGGNK